MRARLLMGLLTLCGLPLSSMALAQSEWIELASERFVLYTDTDLQKGSRLLDDFESRHLAFSEICCPVESRESRINIVLMDERDAFESFLPEWTSTADSKSAYLIQGPTGTYILASDSSPEDILDDVGHPLGHLLLSQSALWQPFWLQEGIGEYIRRLGRGRGDDAVDRDEGFGMSDLLTIVPSDAFNDLDGEGSFRKQSYHLVRILVSEYPEEFRAYVRSLGSVSGEDSVPQVDLGMLEDKVFRYEDSPLSLEIADSSPVARTLTSEAADALLGDLALSAGLDELARSLYQENTTERARVGLVLLRKLQGETMTVRNGFEQLVEVFPESGSAHYHLGTLTPENGEHRSVQIAALQRAIGLMPRMGRAYAELAWLYVQDGRPEDAMSLVEEAIRLEPEFADRFFEVLAEAWLSLGEYAQAEEHVRVAALLPHSDRSSLEHYDRLVPEFYRKIESQRRAREAERVEELRRELEAKVEQVDPRPSPAPAGPPAPIGRVTYSISSDADREVSPAQLTKAPTPVYSDDLRRRGVEGRVVLEVALDRRGRIVDVVADMEADPDLAAASVDAVTQWEFLPARRGLVSTEYSFRLTLRFYIE